MGSEYLTVSQGKGVVINLVPFHLFGVLYLFIQFLVRKCERFIEGLIGNCLDDEISNNLSCLSDNNHLVVSNGILNLGIC